MIMIRTYWIGNLLMVLDAAPSAAACVSGCNRGELQARLRAGADVRMRAVL